MEINVKYIYLCLLMFTSTIANRLDLYNARPHFDRILKNRLTDPNFHTINNNARAPKLGSLSKLTPAECKRMQLAGQECAAGCQLGQNQTFNCLSTERFCEGDKN